MTGNILGEAISEKIDAQINNRQFIQGAGYNLGEQQIQRTPEVLNYLNNRNAWIKMASGVSISGSLGKQKLKDLSEVENSYLSGPEIDNLMNSNLAENLILFNTTQKFDSTKKEYTQRSGVRSSNSFTESINNMYGGLGGNSKGLEPVPGITDISIQCLNRGSIKKATVNIKAYNKFQFGVIELLYLRLGYIMMLEWGWDKYIDSIDTSMNPSSVTIKDMGSTIIENQWFKDTNYTQTEMLDIIQANREIYKGNYDGFFGTVTNFSWKLGKDNVYDITINLSTLGSVIESLNINIPSPLKELKPNLKVDRLTQWVISTRKNFPTDSSDYASVSNFINEDNEPITTPINKDLTYYIRFGHFLRIFQNNLIFNINNGNKSLDKELEFDLNLESTLCNYEQNLVSLNPSKTIFSPYMSKNITKNIELYTLKQISEKLESFAINKDGIVYGKLFNIYLNLDFIQTSYENSKNYKLEASLFKFLTFICEGINESMGQCTQLEVIIKEDKTITFIDQNQIKGYDKKLPLSPTPLNIYGYNPNNTSTFVKDFSIQTKITPDLANIITIGATAESQKTVNAIPFKNINKGLDNRFGLKQLLPNEDFGLLEDNQDNQDKEKIESAELLKPKFADLIRNPKTTPYTSLSGYKFEYNGIKFNVVRTLKAVNNNSLISKIKQEISFYYLAAKLESFNTDDINFARRKTDSENDDFLSLVYSKYQAKFDLNQQELYLERQEQAKKEKKNKEDLELQNSRGTYQAYLARSFGGETGINNTYKTSSVNVNPAPLGTFNVSSTPLYINENEVSQKEALYFDFNNQDHLSLAQNSFKKYLNEKNKNEYESEVISSQGFIPLELGITMEGLSGVKIYNKLNLNTKFLPSSYPKSLKFIATNVDHKVGGNIWETNIKTISMPLSENPPINPVILENAGIGRQNNVLIDQSEFNEEIQPSLQDNKLIIQDNRTVANKPFNLSTYGRKDLSQDWLINEMNINTQDIWRKFLTLLNTNYPGYTLIINATYRSYERSEQLKKQNKNNAKPGLSPHNYAYAIDMNIKDPNGTIFRKNNRTPWIESGIIKIATDVGLRWGGNFSNYIDCVHFDVTNVTNITLNNASKIDPNYDLNEEQAKSINYV